jgi:hypothetical protein
MAYKRTTGKSGKTRITNTQNSNGSRTYSTSTGQKFGGGSSTRSTISTKSNGKRTLTYTTTSPSGWVNRSVTVLSKPSPKPKKYKAPKSAVYKTPKIKFSRNRRSYKTQTMTMGQLKALSIIFGILVLIALFTN